MKCIVKILTAAVLSSAFCGTGYALTQNNVEVDNTALSEAISDSNSVNEAVEIEVESEKSTFSSKSSETSLKEKEVSEVKNEIHSFTDEESCDITVDDCETQESDNMDEKIYEKAEYDEVEYDEEIAFDEIFDADKYEEENSEIGIYESPVYEVEEEPFDEGIVGISESAYDD